MKRFTIAFMLCMLFARAGMAQPEFAPVQIDPGTDESFFYPYLSVTDEGYVRSTWASVSPDWVGAYGREVDTYGNIVGAPDTLDIGSITVVTCPPIVEFQRLSDGAWCKMVYHG